MLLTCPIYVSVSRIDLGGRGEESHAVANFDNSGIFDFLIRSAGNYFKEVPVGSNRRWRDVPQFCAGHLLLRNRVMNPIDLNLELIGFVVFGFVLAVRHETPPFTNATMIPRYRGT